MDTQLIVRLIVSIIAMINMFANLFGFNPLNIAEGDVYNVVSVIAVIVTWAWGFWKNNNFTKAAKDAQEYLNVLKKEK